MTTFVRMNLKSKLISKIFLSRTLSAVRFDLLRLKTRKFKAQNAGLLTQFDNLHLACGSRKIQNWLNVDVDGSDYDVDLSSPALPFSSEQYNNIVMQHAIGCFEVETELPLFLKELYRITAKNGVVWLTTPDIQKVCKAYIDNKGRALIDGRKQRFKGWNYPEGWPPQHFINVMFHNYGELKNIFDFELLNYFMLQAGFSHCEEKEEKDFNAAYPEFPPRNDNEQTLYLKAFK